MKKNFQKLSTRKVFFFVFLQIYTCNYLIIKKIKKNIFFLYLYFYIKKNVYLQRQTNNKKHRDMKKQNRIIELAIQSLVKETEKAVCLNVMVSWNGNTHSRDIWFPKSVCELREVAYDDQPRAFVADWFLLKTESANAFKGYGMRFETAFWK